MSTKGGEYERRLSKQLSLWWTDQKRDDVFWRTSTSGGRATQRFKTGKKTFGQHGDLQAVDPIGAPLFMVFTIEAKKGYSGNCFADMLDRPALSKASQFEKFVEQAMTESTLAGAASWLLVHHRDNKRAMAFMPRKIVERLEEEGAFKELPRPWVELRASVRVSDSRGSVKLWLVGMRFEDFLLNCSPDVVRRLAEKL